MNRINTAQQLTFSTEILWNPVLFQKKEKKAFSPHKKRGFSDYHINATQKLKWSHIKKSTFCPTEIAHIFPSLFSIMEVVKYCPGSDLRCRLYILW